MQEPQHSAAMATNKEAFNENRFRDVPRQRPKLFQSRILQSGPGSSMSRHSQPRTPLVSNCCSATTAYKPLPGRHPLNTMTRPSIEAQLKKNGSVETRMIMAFLIPRGQPSCSRTANSARSTSSTVPTITPLPISAACTSGSNPRGQILLSFGWTACSSSVLRHT